MKIKITLAMLAIGISALGVGCACNRPQPPDGQTASPDMNVHRLPPPDGSPGFDPNKPAPLPPG